MVFHFFLDKKGNHVMDDNGIIFCEAKTKEEFQQVFLVQPKYRRNGIGKKLMEQSLMGLR